MSESPLFSQFGANSGYIREMYSRYLQDPALVDEAWARFFRSSGLGDGAPQAAHDAETQEKVFRLVEAYRRRGHLNARINPLEQPVPTMPPAPELDPAAYGFRRGDLQREFACRRFRGRERMPLAELINGLAEVYCGAIGFEIEHLYSREEREWLQERIERSFPLQLGFSRPERLRMLQKLIDAEVFEDNLHKKYVGHKRFSLQGAESVMPMTDILLQDAGRRGAREIVMGMAHRGRINMLRNMLGKPFAELFSEFEDQNIFTVMGSGDMKYHLGFDAQYLTPEGRELKVSLTSNPSHLEFVSPVVLGICRARQTLQFEGAPEAVLPLLIHGDAAFVGEGISAESLNLCRLAGYGVGGAVHLVIDNQIGFTTGAEEARSTVYCTDFAKAVQAPIFHVNGDDVEAACWAMRLALEYRTVFHHDAVVDLYCYRRYGHNEADDPSFTQPLAYAEIARKPSVAKLYAKRLMTDGLIAQHQIDRYQQDYRAAFDAAHAETRRGPHLGEVCATHGKLRVAPRITKVRPEALQRAAEAHCMVPEGFAVNDKLARLFEKRMERFAEGSGIDWGFAETLAFGTLLLDGVNVRLTGQDSVRGTFGQRHLGLTDRRSGERCVPLADLSAEGFARLEVHNSPLSEAGVLGFEFGYSTAAERSLVLW